jgi:hypothetical protein
MKPEFRRPASLRHAGFRVLKGLCASALPWENIRFLFALSQLL